MALTARIGQSIVVNNWRPQSALKPAIFKPGATKILRLDRPIQPQIRKA